MLGKISKYEHHHGQQNVEIANLKLQSRQIRPKTADITKRKEYKDAFDRMRNVGFVMQSVFD